MEGKTSMHSRNWTVDAYGAWRGRESEDQDEGRRVAGARLDGVWNLLWILNFFQKEWTVLS